MLRWFDKNVSGLIRNPMKNSTFVKAASRLRFHLTLVTAAGFVCF